MPIKVRRKLSKCKGCPLDNGGKSKCYGVSEAETPTVVFLGEAPGAKEEEMGQPFVGPSGWLLKGAVTAAGEMLHRAHKTNTILCRPPNNKIDSYEGKIALEHCREGLYEELYALYQRGTKVIVGVGATAMKALEVSNSLFKSRGSVFLLKWTKSEEFSSTKVLVEAEGEDYDMIFVPTYHPSFLLRGQLRHEVTFANDIEKAYSIAKNGYKVLKEEFEMFPTIEWLEKKTESILKKRKKPLLAVDLETSGFVPGSAAVIVVGIALSSTEAFSVPFLSKGGTQYWSSKDEKKRALSCLQRLFSECPTAYQNALFDCRHLVHLGAPAEKIEHDTMILHHVINPELPHKLEYITSIYGRTPAWKDEVSAKRLLDYDDELTRRYNLRDCVVIHQCLPELIKDAQEHGTFRVYQEISMKLLPVVIEMVNYGMLVDQDALKKWRTYLRRLVTTYKNKLYKSADVPKGFNFNSLDQMRYLLFGIEPAQYARAKKEMKEIEESPKKSIKTKKYKNAKEVVEVLDRVTPFPRLRHALLKTDSGSVSVSEEAMLNIQIAANNRMKQLKEMRQQTEKHKEELKKIERIIKFIATFRKYAEYNKLLSTYTDFPVDRNDRLHSPYRMTGTTTGRFSSGDKGNGEAGNVQNIPEEAKHIFVAPEGYEIAELDHSNLEMIIIAELSDDEVLREVFKKGLNVHDVNCRDMFELDPEHKDWDSARRACKTYIFGRNYGGGLKGIFNRVQKAVPELGLTYARFVQVDDRYRKKHPKYTKWHDTTIKEVSTKRCLSNAFGRQRYFLGSSEEIKREGLNFPIQSTAADIINMSLIRAQDMINAGKLKVKIIGTVHDSILVEVPIKGKSKELKKLKEVMETPVKIGKNDVVFPVEVKSGPSWGEAKKLKL